MAGRMMDSALLLPQTARTRVAVLRLASSRTQAGKYDIYLYNLTTGEIVRVTQDDKDIRYPDWKPSKKSNNP